MALLTTLFGIGLALFAALAGRPWAAGLGIYAIFLGVLCVVLGASLGANAPKAASAAFRGAVLIPLAAGAIAGALGIWLAATIAQTQGPQPTPWASAVGGAVAGLVTALVEKLRGLGGLMPSAMARRLVHWRYSPSFPHLDGSPAAPFVDAYKAIHYDPLQVPGAPPIRGWGYAATARRLAAIRTGLAAAAPGAPPAPAPPPSSPSTP